MPLLSFWDLASAVFHGKPDEACQVRTLPRQLAVSLGCGVIAKIVVHQSPELIGFRVVTREQVDVSVEVGERFFPVRVGHQSQTGDIRWW